MSQQEDTFDLGGHTLREWSFIILMIALIVVIVTFAVVFIMAIMADKVTIEITGAIDVGQFVGIIIGIAIVATTLVAQQLTKNQITSAIKANDDAWLKSENGNKPPGS